MIKIIKFILVLIVPFLLFSCGFKPLSDMSTAKINIQNIDVIGDLKIANYLKNNISSISNKASNNKYNIKIVAEKNKINKIKNKTGQVQRYSLYITTNLKLTNLNNDNIKEKIFSSNQDFNVAKNHSDTIANERSATKNILQQLTDDMVNFIKQYARN